MNNKNTFTKGKDQSWLLSVWHKPSRQIVKRTIALLISVSFLFPTLTWAFDIENYLYSAVQGIELGGTGSRSLALDYTIPSKFGKVVEANYRPGKQTFVLIQDLHCHYEIQKNIAGILDVLTTRYKDINLIAVEGGSGIIPALELAAIPESPAKRAVSDYFMKQGKLTGADYLVINDRSDLELFGAENARLYNSSLALIRQFTTEENRGLVIEILDQLAFIQEKIYHPELLVFENRRKHYLKSDTDSDIYLRALLKEATQSRVALLPKELETIGKQRDLTYHEKVIQQQYLENALREKLFQTTAERQMYQYQVYMELVERAINVSASHEDLKMFQTLSKSVSIQKISETLKNNFGNSYFNLQEDSLRLENALRQAKQFYEYADQRDRALYRNALQRIDDRQEKKVVLITGGYHTSAIQDQLKQDGYSYVTIQPDMSKAESGTHYFELLRYPDQPTEFEKMIARQDNAPNAMAVRNFVTLENFRNQFKGAVDFVNLAMVRMRENNLVRLPGLTMERIRGKLVKIGTPDGSNFMGMLFNRKGMEILDREGVNHFVGDPTLLGSNQIRTISLLMLGTAILSATILPLLGVATAFAPAMTLMAMSLIIIAGWWIATNATGDFLSRVFTKRNIILAALAIGVFALPVLSQMIMADVTSAVANGAVGNASNLQLLLGGVSNTFRFFPDLAAMTPLAHNPVQAMAAIAGTAQVVGSLAMTPIFSGLRFTSLIGDRKIRDEKNSNKVLQQDFADLAVEEAREIIQRRDRERHGEKYEKGQARPAQGAFEIVPEANAAVMLDALVQNGLVRFEDNTPVDFSVKDIQMMEGDYIDEVPTSSEILFQFPKREGGSAHVLFRVLLVDPRFVDKDGKPVYKEIPQKYVTAVLGNLNPFKLFLAYSKELPELLKKAGNQAQGFEQLIKYVAKQWKDKKAPEDFETMREFVTIGMLHEFTHALALHLPDAIPSDATEETRRELEPITFDKYLALINSDQKLQTSVVFNKNILKALRAVKNMDEQENPQSRINAILALEMFCDRFSMFLYENYAKIRIYSENFKAADVPFSVDVDFMLRMEVQRRAGTLRKMRGLENVLRDEEFDKLETELTAAESAHMYISKFGDPKLSADEISFYSKFLDLVKYFDGEKQIMRFTMEHANKSRFMHASIDGLTRENGIGVSDIIKTSENIGDISEGIIQVATQRETGRTTITDYEKRDIEEGSGVDQTLEVAEESVPLINLSATPAAKEIKTWDPGDFITEAAIGAKEKTRGVEGETGEDQIAKDKKSELDASASALDLLDGLDESTSPFVQLTVSAEEEVLKVKKDSEGVALIEKKRDEQNIGNQAGMSLDASAASILSDTNFASDVVAPESNPDLGMYAAAGRAAVPSSFTSPNSMPYFSGGEYFAGNNVAGDLSTAFQNQANLPLAAPGIGTGINTSADAMANQNAQFAANARLNQGIDGIRAVPGDFNSGIPQTALFGKTASDWQAIPSRGIPGQQGFGAEHNPLANFNRSNPEFYRSLGLPQDIQGQILSDQRIIYLLGQASLILPMFPGNQPLTFGFDNQGLADQMNLVLNAMQGNPQGAALASRIQTEVFPQDQKTGQRLTPSNWKATNGIAVLSDQMSNLRPVTVVLNADGNAAVAVPLLGIKKDRVNAESLKSIPGWSKIAAASDESMNQMRNKTELNDFYLVTAATIAELQQSQQGLLANLLTPITGFQDVNNLTVQLPMSALKAAARPAFDAGAKRVVVDLNLAGLDSLLRANQSSAMGISTFGISDIAMASVEYDLNASFIQALLQANAIESAALDMVVNQDALENEYGINRQSAINQWFESLKTRLAQLFGKQVADRMTKEEAQAQADELRGIDNVTFIPKDKRLGEHLVRARGRALDPIPSLFFMDLYNTFRIGRMQNKARLDIDAWNPQVEPTKHSRQRGLSKIFSALLLGFAAGVLVFDTFIEIGRTRDAKGKRLSLLGIMRHPNFIQALQLMSMVVMGNGKALDYLSPTVRQQLSDLQKLAAVKDDTDVIAMQEREAAIDAVKMDEIAAAYPSLKYSLGQFRSFKKMLVNHPIFKFLMRITGIRNILPLYPELFVILSESKNMQSVMWYFAPAVTTRKNFAVLENAHPTLIANVNQSVIAAREQLEKLSAELLKTEKDSPRFAQIHTEIKNARFTVLLNRTLDMLGQNNNNRNVRRVIRVLLKELARNDIENAEAYQEDILKILSLMEPFQQVPIQIVLASGKKVQASIPASLNDTLLRDQLLFLLDVYDSEGKPMQPLRRKVLRAGASA